MYNTYGNYSYRQQPYYMPNYQQPQQQTEMPFSDIRYLNAEQIKGYIPPIGSRVMLIDKDNGLAYIESADNMGNLYKQTYSFASIDKQDNQPKNNIDFNNLATKDDIYQILAEFKAILEQNKGKTSNLSTESKKPVLEPNKQV